jgi:hypothetical protein
LLDECEVVTNLDKWGGQMVAVHGKLIYQPELLSIVGESPCGPVVLDGKDWPTNVSLGWYSATDVPEGVSQTLVDWRSVKALAEITKMLAQLYYYSGEERPNDPPFKITATIIGEVRTRRTHPVDPSRFSIPELASGYGFGPGGMLPAQLVAYSVRDLVVTQLPLGTRGW